MPSTPPPSDMLSELSACAHRLGVAFAVEAEAVGDWRRKLELVQLFDRCFFSVRVAIGLQLRLRREARAGAPLETERAEGLEIERPETPERGDAPENAHTYDERDRDREADRERVSLPLLLATLNGVARDAAALPGPPPAGLSALTALLARPLTDPATRPAPSGLRNRLAGATSLGVATGPPRAGVSTLARRPRPATGPPRR